MVDHWLVTPKGRAVPKTYLEPRQASKIEIYAKIVNGWRMLTIFTKISIFDV